MPTSTNQKIIIKGSPFGYIHSIQTVDDVVTITEKFAFNNLADSQAKLPKPGTTSSGNNTDLVRSDGAKWRFPNPDLILDATDETDITPADITSNSTALGDIVMKINEAPVQSNSFTKFISDWHLIYRNGLFMATIGTGFSYKAISTSALRKPEGWIHLIGRVTSDTSLDYSEKPTPFEVTFSTFKNSGLDSAALQAATFTTLTWKLGGTGKDVTGITPPAITAGIADLLLAGDLGIVTDIVYS